MNPRAQSWLSWLKKQSTEQPVFLFFLFSFTFAWLLWIIAGLLGSDDRSFFRHLCTFASFAPAFAAVVTILLQSAHRPHLRWDFFLGAWLVTGILYFVALPYASTTPLEVSIPAWIMRGVMWLGPAWVAAWALSDPTRLRRLLLPTGEASNAPGWYVLALLGLPVLILVGDALARAAGLPVPTVEIRGTGWDVALTVLMVFIYLLLFGGALNEEPGLRGFALPALQERFSPLVATLILGLLTALWYLPIHLNGFYPSTPESLPVDLLNRFAGTLATAFLFTWTYGRTRGNVLVCVLMHTAFNTASMLIPQSGVTLGLLSATALFAVVDGKMWKKGTAQEILK